MVSCVFMDKLKSANVFMFIPACQFGSNFWFVLLAMIIHTRISDLKNLKFLKLCSSNINKSNQFLHHAFLRLLTDQSLIRISLISALVLILIPSLNSKTIFFQSQVWHPRLTIIGYALVELLSTEHFQL